MAQQAAGTGNSSVSKQRLFLDTDDRRQLSDVIMCKRAGNTDGVAVHMEDTPNIHFWQLVVLQVCVWAG